MEKPQRNLQVGIHEGLIVVTDPATNFFAIYSKPNDEPKLKLMRRLPTNDHELLARALRAANDKARELGWIV